MSDGSFRLLDDAGRPILYARYPGAVIGSAGGRRVEYRHPVYGWREISPQFRSEWERRLRSGS